MGAAGIHSVELIFSADIGTRGRAGRRRQEILARPYPIVLVIGGLILSLFPRGPHIDELNPNIPFSSSFCRPCCFKLRSSLPGVISATTWPASSAWAFGLVGFTVFGVAAAARWILPGFDWRMGLVLGAVVSTTDAIAATSISTRLGLPRRIVQVVEGESLVNDATGLLALEFATALLVTGHTPSLAEGVGRLLYLVFGSIAIGLLIGKLIRFFELKINDAPIEITISLIAPFVAYLAAESARASGVLSTVACGLYLGHKSSLYYSRGARLTGRAVWDTLTFVLNGFVFILIGFQLPYILSGIREYSMGQLLIQGLVFSSVVILLRIIWVYPGAWASYFIRQHFLHQVEPTPSPRAIFVVGWTGMRGVVAHSAAAISLPEMLANGSDFPERNEMIFLTFSVIFVTLVLQGLTLPPLIRALGLAGLGSNNPEEANARREMVEAAVTYLEHAKEDAGCKPSGPIFDDMIHMQRRKLNTCSKKKRGRPTQAFSSRRLRELWREVSRQVRALQRAAILNLRNHQKISDDVMRKLEYEIDLVEAGSASSDRS